MIENSVVVQFIEVEEGVINAVEEEKWVEEVVVVEVVEVEEVL